MADDGGLGRFQRRMRAVPKAVRAAVQPALVKQAQPIAATMRVLAPDDPATGAPDLKTSITVTGPGQMTPAGTVVPENAVAITAGNKDAFHAAMVEHGTRARMQGDGSQAGVHPGTAPQPFFWPAWRMHRRKASAAVKRAISTAIRKNSGKT